jgi:glycosyltransferase involved in cell wall biosynthesis
MISVIIPVYNRTEYLDFAIRSLLEQSIKDIEIIVVDDGSTIDLGPVTESFGDRIRLFRKSNGGPNSARNFGIARARGEYLHFLDDDDFLERAALETLRSAIRSQPGAVWAVGRYVYADKEGRRLDRKPRCFCASGDVYGSFIDRCVIGAMSTVLLKAATVNAVGCFDESFSMAEDYDFWLTLARDYPIVAVDDIIANYRMHGNQSSSNWAAHSESILRVLEKHRKRARPGFESRFNAAIARVQLEYGDSLYWGNRRADARTQWRRSSTGPGGVSRWGLVTRLTKSYLPVTLMNSLRTAKTIIVERRK